MGKYFKALGILIILFISFIYTEKTISVVKEYDEIMIEIRKKAESFNKIGSNAIIKDNTMIPGISSVKINIDKSYSKMKRYGKFNEELFVYDKISPDISIYDNFNYPIVSGNSLKNMVTLLFLVEENNKLDEILKILDENGVSAHFFLNSKWLEQNSIYLDTLIKKGHSIGNYTYDDDFSWTDAIIKKIAKQPISYCYMIDNKDIMDKCISNNNFIIKPNIITKKNPSIEIKKELKAGSLIALDINNTTINELKMIIAYIKNKGYNLTNLNEHLEE